MKNKLYLFFLLAAVGAMVTSCATSHSKYGCPANPSAYHQPARNHIG